MENLQVTFSVIICTLNNYVGLKKCVTSICQQTIKPKEIVIVHGVKGGNIVKELTPIVKLHSITLKYFVTERSLVMQRNQGIDNASGDVIVFLDDDVILEHDYFNNLIKLYQTKWNSRLGGVQGIIVESFNKKSWYFTEIMRKFFLLTNITGKGKLQVSGHPSFAINAPMIQNVEIFSGCNMSFRRDVLIKNRFEEKFREFWMLDDVELSYRISRKFELYQTPFARLSHISSTPTYEGFRKMAKMSVVNRLYIFRKYFGASKLNWCLFVWSCIGEWIYCILQSIKRKNMQSLIGLAEGWKIALRTNEFSELIKPSNTKPSKEEFPDL